MRHYIKAHDGLLLANHGALTAGGDLFAAYYKMETIEHFAKISLVARMLGREHLISREEVMRLQELRGAYGIKAPAPICADPSAGPDGPTMRAGDRSGLQDLSRAESRGDATCQVLQAPSGGGLRLVPDVPDGVVRRAEGSPGSRGEGEPDEEAEIRLTYRELSALIEDAIRSLA